MPDAFLDELLEDMRTAARAGVAVVNESIVSHEKFPLTGPLSRAGVFVTLRYEDSVLRATVAGSWIEALWAKDVERRGDGRGGLAWGGVEPRGDDLWVNGRPLHSEAFYSVVVPDFLAHGGDGWVLRDPGFARRAWLGGSRLRGNSCWKTLSAHRRATRSPSCNTRICRVGSVGPGQRRSLFPRAMSRVGRRTSTAIAGSFIRRPSCSGESCRAPWRPLRSIGNLASGRSQQVVVAIG